MSLLPLTKKSYSYPEGNFGGNQLLGGSMSLSHLYLHLKNDLHINNSYGPPPEFPLASPCAGKVHHHSGSYTSAQAPWKIQSLSLRLYFFRAKTRTTVKLPNPCFKTGAYKMPYPRQVQALCTFCLRILFIVRSHYFYAIGLLMIFSFRWGIPPKLRQHSQATRLDLDTHT